MLEPTLYEKPDDFEHLAIPEYYGGSIRILFVEDNDADMEVVVNSMQASRIANELRRARTAEEAWKFLETATRLPHWIFIDRILDGSVMSGDELIEKICRHDRFKDCRVIVLSGGFLNEHDKNMFTEFGVNVFFPKPLTARNVKDMVETSSNLWHEIFIRRNIT